MKSEKLFDFSITFVSIIVIILVVYPLYFILIASVSAPTAVLSGEVILLPKGFNLDAYKLILEEQKIWVGYKNTIIYTVLGTCINITMTTLAAYPLSRRDMPFRTALTFLISFTMMFGGGLIPTYLVVRSLRLTDSIWAMVIPNAIATYNLLVMKNYFQSSIPIELQESASIDGCTDFRMLLSIILPLSVPIIAVMVLFYSVGHWNSFFNALIYLRKSKLYPLQIILREILLQNSLDMMAGDTFGMYEKVMKGEAMKYSVILISSLPVLILYPFVQKYFVKGIMVGAIKG